MSHRIQSPRTMAWAAALLVLILFVARAPLEAGMSSHMLVQIPLLCLVGALAVAAWPPARRASVLGLAGGPVACVLLASLTLSYWMLPRALDSALVGPWYEAVKFVSLPLLAGAPLALAWPRLGLIGRGFFLTNSYSMLAVLGWLYLQAPVRVCNNYLVDEQARAGRAMVVIAVALFIGWLALLLFAPHGGSEGAGGATLDNDARSR